MYLNDEQIDLDETECVFNENSYTRSFHTILSAKHADELLTPAFWPEGICCRIFFQKRNKPIW